MRRSGVEVMTRTAGSTSCSCAARAHILLGEEAPVSHHLSEPGDGCLVETGTYVRYELETPDAALLVLADKPYVEEPRD